MLIFFKHCHSFSLKGLLRRLRPLAAGFTLVELLVVTAVITIITGFLLFNQGRFNSSTLLRSLAYSVALSVRQAQAYGTSVRGFTQGGSTTFAPGYGVYFSSGDLSRFYVFADINGNTTLDTSPINERLSSVGSTTLLTIGRGYTISKFCGVVSSSVQDCYPSGVGGGAVLTSLTLYFRRPSPDALFYATCTTSCNTPYSSAFIELSSSGNADKRTVKVTNTGQIVVCQLNADPITC